MSNWVGQTLGKVRIDTLLARGGTAEVYIGTHTTLQREVAIKILHSNYDDHPHALERFQREAMVVAKLRHPNIVQVFDFDTTKDSHPYLVMEYIKGPSLLKYLNSLHAKNKQLEFPHIIRLMNAMTSALQYAHDSGVIHRDIKPGNILLTSRSSDIILGKPLPDDFEPILTDFGLVRFIDSTQHTTGSGQIAGTPAYMSPEQARGDLTDGRTDIYSLGIVLYEILAGHLPFEAETTMGVLMKHISEPPAPVPGLPPTMQYVLDHALAKNIDDRFQTPAEFGQAFIAAVENRNDFSTIEMAGGTRQTTRPAKRLFNQRQQRRWVTPVIAGTLIVALGGLALLNGFPGAAASTATPTFSPNPSSTLEPPTATSTSTRTPVSSIVLGRTGVLQFRDKSTLADQAVLIADAMLAPPAGTQYEVWLVNSKGRISLGVLTVDASGKGQLTFTEAGGTNLISQYDSVEVTVEASPDNDPKTSGIVAYAYTIRTDGLTHVRYLLSSFPRTPGQNALIHGLYDDIETINEMAIAMQKAAEQGDSAGVLKYAESIQNIIVGAESPNHRDLDGDGRVEDPSDGYGLLLNGRNQGYLDAVFTEADAIINSADASKQMIAHAEDLKISVQNIAQWTAELQIMIAALAEDPAAEDIQQQAAEVLTLTERMLNGIDLDQDGVIDAEPGESGAKAALLLSYQMADMPLQPVGILNIGTGTPTFISASTLTSGGGGSSGPTQNVPPGQEKTKRPQPTKKNNNNGNGGSGN